MVVFTCGHCGESVNKPKVEKHYLTRCRGRAPNLSCMDCFKDFYGNEHEAHTKCVSEEQRYSAKGFVAKVNKGEAKQSAWVEMVQTVLDEQKNAPKNVIRIVEEICKHSNTPRKKPKFINFVKNVCGHRTMPNEIEAAWDLIAVKLSALSKANSNGIKKTDESNDKVEQNGDSKEDDAVQDVKETETLAVDNCKDTNTSSAGNGFEKMDTGEVKTKKQRKEQRKLKKYEAELQKAGVKQTEEISDELVENKTRKKYKQVNQNGENTTENASKKGKKRKNAQEVNEDQPQESIEKTKKKQKMADDAQNGDVSVSLHDQNVNTSENMLKEKVDKFDWLGVIVSLLQKKGNEMPFKRLQKKVLAEYAESTGRETGDRIAEKLNKKLRGAPNVRVDKNRVVLIV